MKIAVTATGTGMSDTVDPRFGRARYILIIDTETMEMEAVDNSANINAFKGAGIQAAAMLSDKNVSVLLTGFCGPNAFKTLKAAGIKVVDAVSGTIDQALQNLAKGEIRYSTEPSAQGHW